VDQEFPAAASSLLLTLGIPNTSPSPIPPVLFLAFAKNWREPTWPVQEGRENCHPHMVLNYALDATLLEAKYPAALTRELQVPR